MFNQMKLNRKNKTMFHLKENKQPYGNKTLIVITKFNQSKMKERKKNIKTFNNSYKNKLKKKN